jgi:hypothetical protein
MSTLRRLERALVRERARIGVYTHVDDLIARWLAAVDRDQPLPDVDRFIRGMLHDGLYLPTFSNLQNYLAACRREAKIPDHATLVWLLLPWDRRSPR